jgi:signal transduction histidine kinase
MSPERVAGARSPGGPLLPAWPILSLALLACAALLAFLASASPSSWLLALSVLLAVAGALISGACWRQQQHADQLHDARLQTLLLGQLLDVWRWQTDAEHRLVKLTPPQGAPASAWVAGAFSGEPLWLRFNDAGSTLQARLQAQAPLGNLAVRQAQSPVGQPGRPWQLRGLPSTDSHGRFAGHVGVAWPIDEASLRRAAAQLAFDDLLQHGSDALCLGSPAADGAGWQLQRASPAACSLLGLTAPPDGCQPWALALGGLPDGLRQRVLGLVPGQSAEIDGWRIRLTALTPPGDPQDVSGGALLLSLARQAPARESIKPADAALAAEQAAFSYTISHDLRAPIRVVEGFGRILKEDYGAALDRVGRDHLDRMMAAAARMNHMIDALLSLSRLSTQPLAHQPVNLSQLAQWVVDDLQRAAPERQVLVHIAPGMAAQGDPTLLRMVLENLLGNAWKYSAKVASAEVCFEPVTQAGRQVYQVRDNGAGFDMRFADRLFGVFQRLHSSSDFPGNGVGLASTRRIIRRHGGEVWAEGEVGRGARFFFTLAP